MSDERRVILMPENKVTSSRPFLLTALCVCLATTAFSQKDGNANGSERAINLSIEINAPVEKVWSQWTTSEGISKFFAPASRIEAKPMGHFDIYFFPNAPEGSRGAEGNFVLALDEGKMLSFTWDAPPQFPEIRKQRTFVAVRLEKLDDVRTRVSLVHTGWGSGAKWDAVYTYFGDAWGQVVLPFLKYSLEKGPVDWTDFPKKLPTGLKPAIRS